jgi:hypothetical protein
MVGRERRRIGLERLQNIRTAWTQQTTPQRELERGFLERLQHGNHPRHGSLNLDGCIRGHTLFRLGSFDFCSVDIP